MRRQLSILYREKGWQVFALPLLAALTTLVLLDLAWPGVQEAQERIESFERRLASAQLLVSRKPQFQNSVEAAEAVLSEGRSRYFESPDPEASRKAFLDVVTAIFASLNVPSVNIVPETAPTEQGDVIIMKIGVSFDASPSQLARFESLILAQSKVIHVESVSVTATMIGPSSSGVLRVLCTLKSAHIYAGLFPDHKSSP